MCVGIGIDNDIELCLRQQSKSVSQVALCKCLVRASPGAASPLSLIAKRVNLIEDNVMGAYLALALMILKTLRHARRALMTL